MKKLILIFIFMFSVVLAKPIDIKIFKLNGNKLKIKGYSKLSEIQLKLFSKEKEIYSKKIKKGKILINLDKIKEEPILRIYSKGIEILKKEVNKDFDIIVIQPIGIIYSEEFSVIGSCSNELDKVEIVFPYHSIKDKYNAEVNGKSFFINNIPVKKVLEKGDDPNSSFVHSGITESNDGFDDEDVLKEVEFEVYVTDIHGTKKKIDHSFMVNVVY